MKIEKVKEIKENLEEEISFSKEYDLEFRRMSSDTLQEILTLINELENENETIKFNMQETEKASFNINQMNGNLVLENQQLKDRIAELEKENESLYDSYHKGYKVGYEYGKQDAVSSDRAESDSQTSETTQTDYKLKQFAERLKDKMIVHYPSIIENIDETLKEFINKGVKR